MATECTPAHLQFHAFGRRDVIGRFDGGRITSDGGGVLLRETDVRLGLLDRLAGCFSDHRNANSVEHGVRALVAQRVYALALGYEDLNDHDELRRDSLLALLVGRSDLTGRGRWRARDLGCPLAGSSTLNRLELGTAEGAATDRYKRIAADPEAMDRLLVEVFLESYAQAPREIWLDLDATDDPLHGRQEGRCFHGYYRHYCYLLGSNIEEVNPDNLAGAAAARWLRLSPEERERAGLMAPSHKLRVAINDIVRERLIRDGHVGGKAVETEWSGRRSRHRRCQRSGRGRIWNCDACAGAASTGAAERAVSAWGKESRCPYRRSDWS